MATKLAMHLTVCSVKELVSSVNEFEGFISSRLGIEKVYLENYRDYSLLDEDTMNRVAQMFRERFAIAGTLS